MQIFHSIDEFQCSCNPVATVGVFDGVHAGHREILQRLIDSAKIRNCESVVITFDPHPRMVLGDSNEVQLLQSREEKVERFREAGVGNLLIIPFSKEFSAIPPTDFIREVLIEKMGVSKVITGYDHFFGRGRMGDFALLKEMGDQWGFDVEQVNAVVHCNQTVSSSLIRAALNEGNVKQANCMLGYNYSIPGKVIRGNQIGKLIGYPTANIQPFFKNKLIPAQGVYASWVKWNGYLYKGMSNIGTRPTIDANRLTVEVNMFDFQEDIYNESLVLYFIERIRDEKRFGSLELLKEQLSRDRVTVLKTLEKIS